MCIVYNVIIINLTNMSVYIEFVRKARCLSFDFLTVTGWFCLIKNKISTFAPLNFMVALQCRCKSDTINKIIIKDEYYTGEN